MEQRKVAILIILLLAILTVGAWQFSLLCIQDSAPASASVAIDLPLTIHHSATDGTHTYNGSIQLPNSCNELSSGMLTQGLNPPHIIIQLSSNTVACSDATKIETEFALSYTGGDAKKPLLDAVTFNGLEIPYTLVEDR